MKLILSHEEREALDRQIELQLVIAEVKITKEYDRLDSFFHTEYYRFISDDCVFSYDAMKIVGKAGEPGMFDEPARFDCSTIRDGIVQIKFYYYGPNGKKLELRTSIWKKYDGVFLEIAHYLKKVEDNIHN